MRWQMRRTRPRAIQTCHSVSLQSRSGEVLGNEATWRGAAWLCCRKARVGWAVGVLVAAAALRTASGVIFEPADQVGFDHALPTAGRTRLQTHMR